MDQEDARRGSASARDNGRTENGKQSRAVEVVMRGLGKFVRRLLPEAD